MKLIRHLQAPAPAAEQIGALLAATAERAAATDPGVPLAGEDEVFAAMNFFQQHDGVPDHDTHGLPTPVILLNPDGSPR